MKILFTLFALSALSTWAFGQTGPTSYSYDEWLKTARIGGLALEPGASQSEIDVIVAAYKDQGVSVIELDTGLSNYLDTAGFAAQVAHIDLVAQRAHTIGLKVVIYYPSLEVLTPNGANIAETMGKEHPNWLQVGLNGTSNVFYGTQEHWVPPDAESAWMSANSTGYLNYFIGRIQQLAGTAVDGVWIDVPLYLDTGVQWSDINPEAVAAFESWSASKGYNYTGPPVGEDMTSQKFRHWLVWRNDNLADFIDNVRAAAMTTNPDWAFVTEVYPLDYLDTIWTGLEPSVLKRADNSIVVWELDGVSDSLGMEYSNFEDFSNLIAMSKIAKAFDRDRPGWGFSYGNLPTDAGLVMAATISAQLAPFETKTPIMTNSVSADFREKWFDFIGANEDALLKTGRVADVGVWFSPATKVFHDFANGGIYGMYLDQVPPAGAGSWWATQPEQSLRQTDHLAGWRGAAYALNDMHVPYKAIIDPGDVENELEDLPLLWLPSVTVLSDDSAQLIRDYVSTGGTVFATGLVPGSMDDDGIARSASNVADIFGFTGSVASQSSRMQGFGTGVAIYRPDIKGKDLFETGGAVGAAALKEVNHGQVEQIVRIHTPDRIIADEIGEGVHISLSEPSGTEQHAFVLNYSGLQKPAILKPTTTPFHYRPPVGFKVTGATINMPGPTSLSGTLPVSRSGTHTWEVEPMVDQFAIVTFQLAVETPAAPATPPALVFSSTEREDAVNDALDFVIDHLRHADNAAPYLYGIRTNLLDNDGDTTVYTGGHHVTDEHMGLFLRVTALLQDQGRFDEALAFVEEALHVPGYNVLAWSMHKDKLKPFLQPDLLDGSNVWFAANAPLDDFRSIRGMFDGSAAFNQPAAEQLAHTLLDGLYWTSVTDRLRGVPASHAQYPGGIVGYSWDWENHDDTTLTPTAKGSGHGRLGSDLIPVDYQDLGTLAIGARQNPRLRSVIAAAVDMMLDSEITGSPGLFYNGLQGGTTWTGDFEFPSERQGNNLKVIQELWIALHLARISQTDHYVLDAQRRQDAGAAALRSLNFFKTFYNSNGQRVPEYLTFQGTDVPDGNTGNNLIAGTENLTGGEARIYSQLARLALLFGDDTFAADVIEDKILTDQITDPGSVLYGFIGASTSSANDAEAFNVLESLLTLCLEAQPDVAPPPNTAPIATADSLQGGKDIPLLIARVHLTGNDTDAEDDVLIVSAIDSATSQGGTITPLGNRWLYTPPTGFTGSDTFSYTTSDGDGSDSAAATIEVVEGGGISLEISRDGDLTDWPADHFMISDPDDISGAANLLDLLELHLTVQNNRLYIGYVNQGPVAYNWAYTIYFDTDKNPATGYAINDLGAEIILQENSVQTYTGTGDNWSWQTIGLATTFISNDTVELSVPLTVFGGSDKTRVLFVGDNLAYVPNGIGEDIVPNSSTAGNWIHYDLFANTGSIGDPTPPAGNIDGNLSDWPAGHFVHNDPDDVSGGANNIDLRELHLAVNSEDLLIGYVNDQTVQYSSGYLLYIDTDSDADTGFPYYDIGADIMVQDNLVYNYTGDGSNWQFGTPEPLRYAVLGNTVEMAVPLVTLGNPTEVRLRFYGDNSAYSGGTTIDDVPEGDSSYIGFSIENADPNLDSDSDGIPDIVETANGMNPSSAADALLDLDGDGQTALQEYVFGTSITDPNDYFAESRVVSPRFRVSFAGKAGRSYDLQRLTNLHADTWVWITIATSGILNSDQNIELDDPNELARSGIFRVHATKH